MIPAIVLVAALAAAPSSEADELERFRHAHRRTQLAGMGVLTGWAVANIAGGITGALVVESDARFIHEMNALWNSVNLTLGIVGLVNNARRPPKARTRGEAMRVNRRARRVYLINGAIDVGYMAAGALTAGLGRRYGQRRVEGWGTAVVIQGAWLFVFDLAMVIAHERVAARLPVGVAPLAGGGRIGLAFGGRF